MVSCHRIASADSRFLATSGVAGNLGRLQLAEKGCVGDACKESRNQNKGGIFIVYEARLPGECTGAKAAGDDCSYKKKEATPPVSDELVVDPFHFGANVSPDDYVNDYANENCYNVDTQP